MGYGEWKIEELTYFDPPTSELLGEAEVMTFVTSGEPPDKWAVDAYLTFQVAIEGRTLSDIESMILYVQNEVLGSFDRGWD